MNYCRAVGLAHGHDPDEMAMRDLELLVAYDLGARAMPDLEGL